MSRERGHHRKPDFPPAEPSEVDQLSEEAVEALTFGTYDGCDGDGYATAIVTYVTSDFVGLQIGSKYEAHFPRSDWPKRERRPRVGSRFDVAIESGWDAADSLVRVTRIVPNWRWWFPDFSLFKVGLVCEGKLQRRIEGGFLVSVGVAHFFLPNKKASERMLASPDAYLGQLVKCRIVSADANMRSVVVELAPDKIFPLGMDG